jgi:predicted MFS family arabinose efflux permease
LVTAYTAGTAGGPALGGWLFDRAGLPGLAAVMTLCGVVGAGLAWRALRGMQVLSRVPSGGG